MTAQTWKRRNLLHVDELAKLFIETLYRYRKEERFKLHEFVLMPDHVHAIITPNEITVERSMQLIKGGYSHAVGRAGRKALEIWHRGYTDHRIRNLSDYQQHRVYIHQNPVRRKLCERPQDYPWSSARHEFELDEVPQRLKPLVLAADQRHG